MSGSDVQMPPQPQDRLQIGVEQADGYVLISVEGEVDHWTAGLLREQLVSCAHATPYPKVILDLERVTFCDSSGLGAMVGGWKAIRSRDGQFVITRPPTICQTMIERTGLTPYFRVAPTVDAAVAIVGSAG